MAHAATRLRWVDRRDAGMRGVVSGPSGSGRGPNLKAPPPRRGILKKTSQPTNPGLKKSPVASDNRLTFASRPVVVDPYADEVDPYGRGFSSPSEDGAPSVSYTHLTLPTTPYV